MSTSGWKKTKHIVSTNKSTLLISHIYIYISLSHPPPLYVGAPLCPKVKANMLLLPVNLTCIWSPHETSWHKLLVEPSYFSSSHLNTKHIRRMHFKSVLSRGKLRNTPAHMYLCMYMYMHRCIYVYSICMYT